MEKRTLIAVVAFVALGLGAFAVLRSPEKGQRTGPAPRPIGVIKSAELTALEVTSEKQEKVTLEKTGAEWRVKSPSDWRADQAGVKSLVDALEKMTFGDLVTEGTEKHAELGVADGKAARIVAKAGTRVVADLYVGKSVGGFTMVRPAGKNEVWQAGGLYAYLINKDAKGWRDHIVFDFSAADADKLTVDGGGAKLALSKLGDKDGKSSGDAKWKIDSASGDAPKTTEALDVTQVNGAVQAMATLRAADFADDKKPAEVGLEPAALSIAVEAKGATHTLLVGQAKGDDIYVKAADQPTIYTVKKYSLERLQHPPIDYRDKTLAKVKKLDLAAIDLVSGTESITLEHSGEKWTAKGGKGVDEGKVAPVVSAFENLVGSGFSVEKDPAKTGLAKPTGSVTLHLKDKSTVALRIGAVKDGTDYYVQKVGSPDVYLVKKYIVDRFLKKPADLGAATKTADASTAKKKK